MDKFKRVAIYSNTWDANGGGGIVYILAIAKLLTENRFDVTVFFNETFKLAELHARYETAGLKIKSQKISSMPLMSQIYFALKEKKDFDIVIQQSLIAPRLTLVKKSFILCDFPMRKIETLSEKVRLRSWKNVLVNSEYTKVWVKNYWKRDATVIYPPIEKPIVLNRTRNMNLVCVGRFNNGKRSKRQDVVISVFKDLVKMGYSQVNLLLLGYVQDKDYLNELKESAIGYPVFFYENDSSIKRAEFLNQSSIFISACGYGNDENKTPMLVEHFGISVVEAMALGCIPVVTGKGGHMETVDHEKNGYHWNTKEQLSFFLIKLLESKQLREKMSTAAYLKSEKYSVNKLEVKLLRIFNKH